MNIYDLRFIDANDKVSHIQQYGNSVEEIEMFWKEWWPKHYAVNPSLGMFVDCELIKENVVYPYGTEFKDAKKLEDAVLMNMKL